MTVCRHNRLRTGHDILVEYRTVTQDNRIQLLLAVLLKSVKRLALTKFVLTDGTAPSHQLPSVISHQSRWLENPDDCNARTDRHRKIINIWQAGGSKLTCSVWSENSEKRWWICSWLAQLSNTTAHSPIRYCKAAHPLSKNCHNASESNQLSHEEVCHRLDNHTSLIWPKVVTLRANKVINRHLR